MSDYISFDWFILLLRLAFIALLYLFLYQIVRVSMRELVALSRSPAKSRGSTKRRTASLVVIEPAESALPLGTTFSLNGQTVVGRHPDCDLIIQEPYMSSEHAELMPFDGRWQVKDLGSTNGTYLNGHSVLHPEDIQPGDVIQFGRVKLEFLP
ncbi:MAG: FHA domain-containing protein [Thermomicrobiales bacterium]